MYAENIIKAAQSADLLRSDLRAAYRDADQVECILIEQLIAQAAAMEATLKRLQECAK